MLKIGDFSKLSRVSIRMLRHYDDIGLLKPAEIDEFTGYRYYQEEQLFTIGRITSLKDMGFSLAEIIRILENYDDKEKMEKFLLERQEELQKLSEETSYKLMLLESARDRLRKEQKMNYDVTVKTIPERKDQESSFFSLFPDGGSPFGFSPEGGASCFPPSGPPLLLSEEDSVTSVIASPVDAVPSLYATPFT